MNPRASVTVGAYVWLQSTLLAYTFTEGTTHVEKVEQIVSDSTATPPLSSLPPPQLLACYVLGWESTATTTKVDFARNQVTSTKMPWVEREVQCAGCATSFGDVMWV